MAGVAPANAPLPPVPVVVSAALSDDMPVVLDSTDVVVQATPCLEWEPTPAIAGAAPQVAASHWKMLRGFIAKCSFASDPITFAMALTDTLLYCFETTQTTRCIPR